MKLSRKNWNSYVTRLSAINKTAGKKMQAWINKHGTDNVEALVEYAYALTTSYGEAASAAACQMYDEIAEIQQAHVPPAEPKPTQHINYVDKAIRSTLDRAPSTVPSTVSEMVKRTGAETTLKNAQRDGAYFAWVPNGDTCAFCLTLASNGWRRASRKTVNGDHADHIHQNCNCEFAISFNGPGEIEGYDPDKYLAMYEGAEGSSWKDKVNSMRREHYAANKDMINAQKRAAYARRTTYKMAGEVELPKDFGVPTKGTQISAEQLAEFEEKARAVGIEFDTKGAEPYGGFDTYCGDPKVLDQMIDDIVESKAYWGINNQEMPIKLRYESLGNIDDLAKTKGGVITLNKDIFDDTDYLKRYYSYLASHGTVEDQTWFVRGTDYRSVIWHEIGHRLFKYDNEMYGKVRKIILAEHEDIRAFGLKYLSQYAIISERGKYVELLSELLSATRSSDETRRAIAERILQEVIKP